MTPREWALDIGRVQHARTVAQLYRPLSIGCEVGATHLVSAASPSSPIHTHSPKQIALSPWCVWCVVAMRWCWQHVRCLAIASHGINKGLASWRRPALPPFPYPSRCKVWQDDYTRYKAVVLELLYHATVERHHTRPAPHNVVGARHYVPASSPKNRVLARLARRAPQASRRGNRGMELAGGVRSPWRPSGAVLWRP